MALAAFAPQQDPAQNGHVVERLDERAAFRTAGARPDNRHTLRNPRNADVEKAADGQSKQEKHGNGHTFTLTQGQSKLNCDAREWCPMLNEREADFASRYASSYSE